MNRQELKQLYFNWLCGIVYPWDKNLPEPIQKTKLLWFLFNVPYYSPIAMDGNRISDGEDLRYEFGDIYGYDDRTITTELFDIGCSMLEMMIGLAIRCEKQIMYDPSYGDRTSQWFREMIKSLGFDHMTNLNYDEDYVSNVVERFLEHKYAPNGSGSLFALIDPPTDMRNVELWSQLCAYLNEYNLKTAS